MTWIVGSADHPTGAVLIGDIRVTFKDRNGAHDGVRKIHQVAPNIVCGFAGSVKVGFEMVDSLRQYIIDGGWSADCAPTGRIVWKWWRQARHLWASVDPTPKALGCSLMIAGAQPAKGFVHKNSVYRLRHSSEFRPERITRDAVSIGSGSGVESLLKAMTTPTIDQYTLAQQHQDLSKVHPLGVYGRILATAIQATSAKAISPHLHLCVVRCNDILWAPSHEVAPKATQGAMPVVATDWPSFAKFASTIGAAAEAAVG